MGVFDLFGAAKTAAETHGKYSETYGKQRPLCRGRGDVVSAFWTRRMSTAADKERARPSKNVVCAVSQLPPAVYKNRSQNAIAARLNDSRSTFSNRLRALG